MIRHSKHTASLLPVAFLLGGCVAPPRSPTVDVLGSYFPAWIVCAFLAVAFTTVVRLLLVGTRLDDHVGPKAIFYPCLVLSFSLEVWLIFYRG